MLHAPLLTLGFVVLMLSALRSFWIVKDKNLGIEEIIPIVCLMVGIFGLGATVGSPVFDLIKNQSRLEGVFVTGVMWFSIIMGLATCYYIDKAHIHRLRGRG